MVNRGLESFHDDVQQPRLLEHRASARDVRELVEAPVDGQQKDRVQRHVLQDLDDGGVVG